jgi:hypothetical protein
MPEAHATMVFIEGINSAGRVRPNETFPLTREPVIIELVKSKMPTWHARTYYKFLPDIFRYSSVETR